MKKVVLRLLVTTCTLIPFSCQKGINWDTEKIENPVSSTEQLYGFTLKENEVKIRGCIDTAYYQRLGSNYTLNVIGTDSAGKKLLITFLSATATFTAGSYGSATNNGTVKYGDYSTSAVNTTFSFEAATISDGLLEGTFSFFVASTSTSLATKITEGQIKARIGKRNPC